MGWPQSAQVLITPSFSFTIILFGTLVFYGCSTYTALSQVTAARKVRCSPVYRLLTFCGALLIYGCSTSRHFGSCGCSLYGTLLPAALSSRCPYVERLLSLIGTLR